MEAIVSVAVFFVLVMVFNFVVGLAFGREHVGQFNLILVALLSYRLIIEIASAVLP